MGRPKGALQKNRKPTTRQCQRCKTTIIQLGSGRPKKYCCKSPKKKRPKMADHEYSRPYSSPTYKTNRARLLANKPQCTYCGAPATEADHIVPLLHGGGNEIENLTPACKRCNSRRGNRHRQANDQARIKARAEALQKHGQNDFLWRNALPPTLCTEISAWVVLSRLAR